MVQLAVSVAGRAVCGGGRDRWSAPRPAHTVGAGRAGCGRGVGAQKFADAATAAFTESAVGSDLTVSPEQRRTGLPTDPVTGLTSQTAAGPVQIVLPGGLGRAEHTPGGRWCIRMPVRDLIFWPKIPLPVLAPWRGSLARVGHGWSPRSCAPRPTR